MLLLQVAYYSCIRTISTRPDDIKRRMLSTSEKQFIYCVISKLIQVACCSAQNVWRPAERSWPCPKSRFYVKLCIHNHLPQLIKLQIYMYPKCSWLSDDQLQTCNASSRWQVDNHIYLIMTNQDYKFAVLLHWNS